MTSLTNPEKVVRIFNKSIRYLVCVPMYAREFVGAVRVSGLRFVQVGAKSMVSPVRDALAWILPLAPTAFELGTVHLSLSGIVSGKSGRDLISLLATHPPQKFYSWLIVTYRNQRSGNNL